ncbi:hypothetical protein RG47T_3366 [Mucilaginibacter polytrichastri]|uniref:Uncharacterized protein n=1 Tax=Mucilaginibacter polytrichastri TaxID=1302689 RepID=A0A1Q6A1L8_9SPHI|nr:hypothetical protein RG47T_3366 [Mucilaginibacter polytrichastri]
MGSTIVYRRNTAFPLYSFFASASKENDKDCQVISFYQSLSLYCFPLFFTTGI